ncbi:MAG TPA: hypothetical protein VKQ36_09540 [Ktedonobacterales bacterium]|nr:hypothetical protein [Ktedonobacterales bacterium]
MANALSDHMEAALLNWLKGTTFPAAPTTLYVGLFTALPGDTGTTGSPADGTEVTASNGYARVALTTSSGWSAIGGESSTEQYITNAGAISFPAATGSWGTIVGYGVWDASTSGNLIFYGTITSQAITNGMTPSHASGQINIAFD